MYTIAVRRELIAQHFMIDGDFGAENHLHSHAYRVEVRLTGPTLDGHGFLVDIDAVAAALDAVLADFRDRTLNELPPFQGLNPSIERLARILWHALRERLKMPEPLEVCVTVWESDSAWAAYTEAP